MLYFKIECDYKGLIETGRVEKRLFAEQISDLTDLWCTDLEDNAYVSVENIRGKICTIILLIKTDYYKRNPIKKLCEEYIKNIGIDATFNKSKEITRETFLSMLNTACRNIYVGSDMKVMRDFGIDDIAEDFKGDGGLTEKLIISGKSKKYLLAEGSKILCEETLNSEVTRIYEKKFKDFLGHPTHYIEISDDNKVLEKMTETLLSALKANNRIISKSVSILHVCFDYNYYKNLRRLYNVSNGGTVVIAVDFDDSESEFADLSIMILKDICDLIQDNQHKVLTVFQLKRNSDGMKAKLEKLLPYLSLIEIKEETVFVTKAQIYLEGLARGKGIAGEYDLIGQLPKSEKGYLTSDLNKIFYKWYDEYLRTKVFTQYKDIKSKNMGIEEAKGTAIETLRGMIGLEEAKNIIEDSIAFYKAQKLFKDKGIPQNSTSMHMVFTGNPGTAKTTVARLFAQIIKDNEIVKTGGIVEVGRADLVGKYVGWTAQIIKEKFQQAKGGVLFIDEAYSLVDDRKGMFGDEAINAIVQEMENHREDTIVIFAGYPKEMEEFLARNPGLKSRVGFHIKFNDYTENELVDMIYLMAKENGMCIGADSKSKLLEMFSRAIQEREFGNGRFARNIYEKAKRRQGARLIRGDIDSVTREEAVTIKIEDFDGNRIFKTEEKRLIGF